MCWEHSHLFLYWICSPREQQTDDVSRSCCWLDEDVEEVELYSRYQLSFTFTSADLELFCKRPSSSKTAQLLVPAQNRGLYGTVQRVCGNLFGGNVWVFFYVLCIKIKNTLVVSGLFWLQSRHERCNKYFIFWFGIKFYFSAPFFRDGRVTGNGILFFLRNTFCVLG